MKAFSRFGLQTNLQRNQAVLTQQLARRQIHTLKQNIQSVKQAQNNALRCLVQVQRNNLSTSQIEISKARAESHTVRADIPRGKNRKVYDYKIGDLIHGFKVQEIQRIEQFDIVAYKLEHVETGAKWLHMDSSDLDNVFAVLFRTPPDDHTGKPHILEHLALCGSKHYPIRDPFFNMLKRSLNTYMNAWTGSDFTMYPFSSQNAQDYRNLLSVYTDSAFFPNLNYYDFRQEGHRIEFKNPSDSKSGLEYKGVVYNEMKGAMSNPDDAFMHKLNQNLFSKSQYRFNSGGEPKHITDLSYDELVAFHKQYYHPSNSTFFTYGDLDFADHIKFVENEVLLPNFKRNSNIQSEIAIEDRLDSPIHKEEQFMPDLMSPADQQAKLGLSFLCNFNPASEPYESFCLQVLSQILLQGPNAPFYKSVIEAGLAPNFCPGVGFDHTTRQPTFTLGVQGISNEQFKEAEKVLFETLADVSKNGIEASLFNETLHQIELSVKKTQQNTGLMYISHMVPYALHGGDPLSLFKINEFSSRIREEFKNGGLFENLINKHLSSNSHYLRLMYTSDPQKAQKEEAAEAKHLKALASSLTEDEIQHIIKEAADLKRHQETLQDHTVLPTLSLNDIPKQITFTESEVKIIGNLKVHFFEQPTNGISYFRLKVDLKKLPQELRLFVPLFAEFLSDIGTKNYRYDEFNNKMQSCTSGLKVDIDRFCQVADHEDLLSRNEQLLLSTGFLDRNIDSAFECLTELLSTPNFDDAQNISDLLKMESINKANNIGNKGLAYAKSYSASGLKAYARSFELLRNDIFFCQYAAEVLKTAQPLPLLKDAIHRMTDIASHLFREENMEIAIHGSKSKFPLIQMKVELLLNAIKNQNSRYTQKQQPLLLTDEFKEGQVLYKNFFKTPLQVNMCAESLLGPTVLNEDDYASMLILQEIATYVFLHTSVREKGGAYGAGCSISESGIITMTSYRDPNCDATYENFERAVAEIIDGKFNERELNEAKLLAFQKLDRVLEPSLRGLVQFTRGYSDEQRMRLRLKALEVRKEDIIYVAEKYMMNALEHNKTSRVVFGSQNADFSSLEKSGWNIFNPIDFLSYSYFDQFNKKQ